MCAQAFIKLASCLACARHLLFFFFCFTRMCLAKRDSLRHVHTYIISSRWHKQVSFYARRVHVKQTVTPLFSKRHAFPDDPLYTRWCNRDTALLLTHDEDWVLKACQQWMACCASSLWYTVMVKISSSPALLPFVLSINDMANTVPHFTPWFFVVITFMFLVSVLVSLLVRILKAVPAVARGLRLPSDVLRSVFHSF